MTNQLFKHEWDKLEKSTLYYRMLLEQLPMEVLSQKPRSDKWSPLEIMEHLAGAEGAALQHLERRQYKPLKSGSLLPGSLRAFLLSLAMRSPLKFKAPEIAGLMPTNTTPPAHLLLQWRSVRQGYYEYLEQVPRQLADKPMFRHPRAGALTLQQMLQFMRDHLLHHRQQIEVILGRQAQR